MRLGSPDTQNTLAPPIPVTVSTASEAENLDVAGRAASTHDTRQMRQDQVFGSFSNAIRSAELSRKDSPLSHDSDSENSRDSGSSRDSTRFAVIVPVPEESLSNSERSDQANATPAGPPARGRVMAIINDAIGFFIPRQNEAQGTEDTENRQLSVRFGSNDATLGAGTVGSIGSAGQALFKSQLTLDPDYLSRSTEGAQRIEYDACVDICFMPNRTGTRGPTADMTAKPNGTVKLMDLFVPSTELNEFDSGRVTQLNDDQAITTASCRHMRVEPISSDGKIGNCFMCHPDAGQIVVMDREFRVHHADSADVESDTGVMMTLNKKPYTDKEHILIFPTKHLPQAYNADLFSYSLSLLSAAESGNKLIDRDNDGEAHNYTVLFAGPVGGSQSHHHQHLINKKTNLQSFIETNPQAVKKIVFADNPQNGIFRVTSEALNSFGSDEVFDDPKRGQLHFFDCLMVKGDADYVEQHTSKIIDHLNETQEDGTVRARYNMAILPIDEEGNYRSIIFPRSTDPGTDHVTRPILWGENTFPPSAHEMCGHWFMTQLPVNNSDMSKEEFDFNVRRAIYKAAHDVRAPIDTLELDKLYQDEVTLVPSAGVRFDQSHSTPEFPAANWYGWDDLAVDGEKRNPNEGDAPLRSCLTKPEGLRRDTDFIKPEMSQTKVNELYETLDFVAKLFKQFEIPYFGGAGTSLSAVRHGGQMPNDDDADLFLPFSAATQFESEEVQNFITNQGYRVDTYSELSAEKGTHLVYQIRRNDGRNIKDTPFVDIAFMQEGNLAGKPVWEFSVGRKDGSRSYYRLPEGGFKPENMREIAFGRRKDDAGEIAFQGVPIMVPNEKNVQFHLDGAYGKNWYQTNFVPGIGPLYISDRGHIPYKGDKLQAS